MSIEIFGKWGNARELAARNPVAAGGGSGVGSMVHGMTGQQIDQLRGRFEQFLPNLAAGAAPQHRARQFFRDLLPEGANLDPSAGATYAMVQQRARTASRQGSLPNGGQLTNGFGSSMQTAQMPYQPEFASPDRQSYPIHRCLVEGELVLYASGRTAPVEAVEIGDELLGPDGQPRRVEVVWSEGRPEQLVEIEWANGRTVRCTKEHVWPTARGDVPAAELTRGDLCMFTRRFVAGDAAGAPLARLAGYYAAEGNILRNPNNGEAYGLRFSLHLDEVDLEHDIMRCVLEAFDPLALRHDDPKHTGQPIPRGELVSDRRVGRLVITSAQRLSGTNAVVDVKCDCGQERTYLVSTLAAGNTDSCGCRVGFSTSVDEARHSRYLVVKPLRNETDDAAAKRAARWCFEHIGEGSPTKALSVEVMAWPVRDKLEFLIGYLRGDGSKRLKPHQTHPTSVGREVSYNTTSRQLGWQVSLIALQCGFPGRTHERAGFVCATGVWHNAKIEWALGGERAGRLAEIVWPDSDVARHEAANRRASVPLNDDFAFVAVRRVEVVENAKQQRVYDLTVSGDHLYCLAGGLVTHNSLANIYWRLFYKLDPIIGMCIDLFSEMVWSNFELSGVDGEVKDVCELMCDVTQLRANLPFFVREFLVLGEVAPHLYWDDDEGIWTHLAFHNPDQLEVIYSPFLPNMEPIVEFRPDDRLRQILTTNHPMLRPVRETMPPELIAALTSGQNIPLSPVNCTFIPRRMHPYDIRGTSIISRMWRILMYEDSIFSAAMSVARRQACFVEGTPVLTTDGLVPIEDVKIGDRVVSGDGSIQTVEQAWAELPGDDGLVEIQALGTPPLFCTPSHNFKVWATPRTCACGCGQPVAATYDRGTARRRAFINGHHLRRLRDEKTGQMSGDSIEWQVYSTEPKLRAPVGYEPLQKLPASEIRVGDYLVIPRAFNEIETDVRPEAARLLGYFAAEGARRTVWQGSEDARSGREGRTTVYLQRQKDEHFARWLRAHAGDGANHHKLSEDVMRWPLTLKREFVVGYFRGNGHLGWPDGCPQVTATSASRTLIYQVRLILAQLGFFGSIYRNEKPAHPEWTDCWTVSSTGRDARQFGELVWGVKIDAPPRDRGNRSGGVARTWCDAQYVYVPVQAVERHADSVRTYNLTVSGDASYLAECVQTFNSPLKVAKLGDQATGWIPDPAQEQRLLELLVQAETDASAWLVYHYGIQFELVGAQERAWKIEQTAEFIERTKLLAMGISKSFVYGEVTYASAASGLTVFLQRLKALREFFESVWIYPKFFRAAAVMNRWVKPTEAELSHKVRTKRSRAELRELGRYIVPRVEWDRPLDPSIDSAMIGAIRDLSGLGVVFSRQTLASLVNRDHEKELEQRAREAQQEQELLAKHPELQVALQAPGDGGGGGGIVPGLPPAAMGMDDGGGEGGMPPPDMGEGGPPPTAAEGDNEGHAGTGVPWDAQGRYEGWGKDEAEDLVSMLQEGARAENEPWSRMLEGWQEGAKAGDSYARAALRAVASDDPVVAWEAVEEWLLAEGYPPKQIRAMEAILRSEQVLPPKVAGLTRSLSAREVEQLRKAEKLLVHSPLQQNQEFFTGATPPRRHR